jgi:hypothetical protein
MNILTSNICSAFSAEVIGSRVTNQQEFLNVLESAIAVHDASKDGVSGQHSITLSDVVFEFVSAGVGKRSVDPDDYVLRNHRGRVLACLRRGKAAQVEAVVVIVYTCEAYLADPEVVNDSVEFSRVKESDCTHVLVAVLASTGPRSPLTAHRFVSNLSGGNKEVLGWSIEEIRSKANEISAYWDEWDVVAD